MISKEITSTPFRQNWCHRLLTPGSRTTKQRYLRCHGDIQCVLLMHGRWGLRLELRVWTQDRRGGIVDRQRCSKMLKRSEIQFRSNIKRKTTYLEHDNAANFKSIITGLLHLKAPPQKKWGRRFWLAFYCSGPGTKYLNMHFRFLSKILSRTHI